MAAELTEGEARQAQSLLSIFDEQDADGQHKFTDDDVRHVLPLLILGAELKVSDCSPPVQELLGEFVLEARLNLNDAPEKVSAQIKAFYSQNPAEPALMGAVAGFLRNPASAAAAFERAAARVGGGWAPKK